MQTSPSQTSTKTRGNNVKDTINSFKSHMLVLILLKTALYQNTLKDWNQLDPNILQISTNAKDPTSTFAELIRSDRFE
jgi:hypothetical protein